MKVKALNNKILAIMVDRPDGFRKSKSGLITSDKDNDVTGIRPRWFKVYSVGEGIDWVNEDQYVFVAHGRWSNGIKLNEDTKLYLLDNDECLAVQDEDPMQ